MLHKVEKIALFGNCYQAKKSRYVEQVLRTLLTLGVEFTLEHDFAAFLKTIIVDERLRKSLDNTFVVPNVDADIALSIGGDGTFLNTASLVGHNNIPILGINTGHLGFLADVNPDQISASLQELVNRNIVIEERSVLKAECDGVNLDIYPCALNEVAILKHAQASLIHVKTSVNGEFLGKYTADGVIISTPTGSTGYSLACGGPVLVPESRCLAVTAVAPHSIALRPIIVRDDVTIELEIYSRTGDYLLAVDGRNARLPITQKVRIHRADYTVKVVKVSHQHFFSTLQEKMKWGLQ